MLGVDSFTSPFTSCYDPGLERANAAQMEDHASWTFLKGDLVDLDPVSLAQILQ